MRTLVCGGLDYLGDVSCLADLPFTPSILIHGGARGADSRAGDWAHAHGIHTARVDALWNLFNKGAGYKRNFAMLILQPEYCVAFPGGSGTASMVQLCEENNIPVWRPYG